MNKKLKFLLIFSIATTIGKASFASNLEDAIAIAKANNKTIKFEDYKLQAAESLKDEAVGAFLPNVSASGQYGKRKSNINNGRANNTGYNNNRVEELRAEQPIFDGFGSIAKYNEADYKVRSATLQNQSKKQEISFEAVRVYCNLFRYQEILKIQEENKRLIGQIYELAKNRNKKKILDKSDVIKFEYELSEGETHYFEALNKFSKSQFEYQNVIGELHKDLIMPTITKEKFDKATATHNALLNNHNLRSYHFNYLASKSAYSAEKSAFAPSVSLVGSISKQQNAIYLNGSNFENRTVSLNVTVPLFQKGVEYSNLSKAKSQSSAAREELEVNRGNLTQEIGSAIEEYDFYTKLSQANEQLLTLAENRADILIERLNSGVGDSIEALRAEIEMNQRKIEFFNSKMDLVTSYYKIKFLLGEMQI